MEKKEALAKITDMIDTIKLLPTFPDKAKLVQDLKGWYDMVYYHKPIPNYDYLCWKEAKSMFDNKMSGWVILNKGR